MRRTVTTTIVRTVITVVAVVVTLGTFLLVGGESVDARSPLALPLQLGGPARLSPTTSPLELLAGSVLICLAFLAAVAAFLVARYRDESSTAAVGLPTIPLRLWTRTLLAVAIDHCIARRALVRRTQQRGNTALVGFREWSKRADERFATALPGVWFLLALVFLAAGIATRTGAFLFGAVMAAGWAIYTYRTPPSRKGR